jgi:phosphate transport system substrate-binding protein
MCESRRRIWLLPALCAAALTFLACDGDRRSETLPCLSMSPRPSGLIVAGSGSNLPLVRRIVQRYRQTPGATQVIIPQSIGTRGAVRALLDGAIDIGLASRELQAAERRRGIVAMPLGRTAVVFAAHRAVRTAELSRSELVAIYAGQRLTWADGTPMVPLLREPGDSGRLVLRRWLPDVEDEMTAAFAANRFRTCYTDAEMESALVTIPGSIGLIDEGTVRLEGIDLRALRVDPEAPRSALKPLYLLTRGPPRGAAARFVAYARSPATADIYRRGGYAAF